MEDNKKDDEEMFSSLKDLPGGENDNKGKALIAAIVTGVLGAFVMSGFGIKGGIVGVVPAILALVIYKMVKNGDL